MSDRVTNDFIGSEQRECACYVHEGRSTDESHVDNIIHADACLPVCLPYVQAERPP